MFCGARSGVGVAYVTCEPVRAESVHAPPVGGRRPTGWRGVAGDATAVVGHRIGHMAEGTSRGHSAGTAYTWMANSAGGGKGRLGTGAMAEVDIVPVDTFARGVAYQVPLRRMSRPVIVAALATVAASTGDADIVTGIGRSGLAVTGFAGGQVRLGGDTVGAGRKERAVQRMARASRSTTAIVAELDRQRRVRELMTGVVAVTAGVVATETGLVVSDTRAWSRSVHIDLTVPVVTDGLRERIECPVVGTGRQGAAGRGIVAFDAVTDRALVMERSYSNDGTVINQLTAERRHFRFESDAVRRKAMTAGAVESEGRHFGMAVQAADANPTLQINAVTEGTGLVDISRSVMEKTDVGSSPGHRMCIGRSVTATGLTAGTTLAVDADVETGVAPGTASRVIGMTGLAGGQIGFGVGAVVGGVEIRSVHRMRCLAGAVGVAAEAVETGGKTARRSAAPQQIGTVTSDTVDVTRRSRGSSPMSCVPVRRMRLIVRGRTGISIGAPRENQGDEQ